MFLLTRFFSIVFILGSVCFNNSAGCALFQKAHSEKLKKPMKHTQTSNIFKLQSEITGFLNTWLVAHDFDQALNYFSSRVTANKVMLNADCAGYIKDEQRSDTQAVRSGIKHFLRDFAADQKGKDLYDILQIDRLNQENLSMVLSDVKKDRYLLVKVNANQLGQFINNSHVANQLRSDIKSNYFYVSMISLEDGILYFLWIEESNVWKIYYADMICV